jgi:hypothetical protein
LGQVKVDDPSNEIAATPAVLRAVVLWRAIGGLALDTVNEGV